MPWPRLDLMLVRKMAHVTRRDAARLACSVIGHVDLPGAPRRVGLSTARNPVRARPGAAEPP